MKSKIFLLFIALISTLTIAQTKVGTINNDYIINLMPEAKTVIKMSQEYGVKIDSSFSIKVNEFKIKFDEYKLKEKEMGELEKKVAQNELSSLDKDIQLYKKNGEALMEIKRNELMRPLYTKLNNAITEICKANGYTQILTTTGNQFAYIDPKYDITQLVIKKLGIVVPEVKE